MPCSASRASAVAGVSPSICNETVAVRRDGADVARHAGAELGGHAGGEVLAVRAGAREDDLVVGLRALHSTFDLPEARAVARWFRLAFWLHVVAFASLMVRWAWRPVAEGTIGAVLLNAALPGRSVFRVLIMPPWIVPIAIGVFMWSWLYQGQFGMISGIGQRIGLLDGPFEFMAYRNSAPMTG